MLRNVTKVGIKFCTLRNNRAYTAFIVTILHNNSVLTNAYLSFQNSPVISEEAYLNVNSLWKTYLMPVETMWNQ